MDVIADILRTASTPSSRTNILYAANLSSKQVARYVEMLVALDMLVKATEEGARQKFIATDRGRAFLSQISSRFGTINPGERSVWAKELPFSAEA